MHSCIIFYLQISKHVLANKLWVSSPLDYYFHHFGARETEARKEQVIQKSAFEQELTVRPSKYQLWVSPGYSKWQDNIAAQSDKTNFVYLSPGEIFPP